MQPAVHGHRDRHGQRQPRRDRTQERRLALDAVAEARHERVADRVNAVVEAGPERPHGHVPEQPPDRGVVVIHATKLNQGAVLPSISSSRTACGKSGWGAAGAGARSCDCAVAGERRPLRDIVRAIIAAAIGVANEVPSHSAQPLKAIVGSNGLVVAPSATFVFALAKVDCRFEPRAVASTHGP